jgi:SAM-dependent methyltransferase
MVQDLGRIAAAYDIVAREYAEAFRDEHEKKPMDGQMLGRFAREMGDAAPVWDLGCGPGQTTKHLRGLGIHACGLDLSERLIDRARAAHPGIHFRTGNLLDLDFPDASIAGVVCFYAIVHFSNDQAEQAFREMWRVLRPGGMLLLTYHIGRTTMHLDRFLGREIDLVFTFFTTDFVTGSLVKCGFEKVEVIERDPYPEVEYQSRRAYAFAKKPTASV